MKEYGTYLKDRREEKGLTIERVSKETYMIVDVIESIESMNRNKFPSDTHLIGFLRLYARYLKIDPEEVVSIFKSNVISETPVSFDAISLLKKSKKFTKTTRVTMLAIVAALVAVSSVVFLVSRIGAIFQSRAEQKQQAEQNSAPRVSNIYENNVKLKKSVMLVKDGTQTRVTVTSVAPPEITVGSEKYTLKRDTPVMVAIGNNARYAVILRGVDVADRRLLLRFDPRSENPSLPPSGNTAVDNLAANVEKTDGKPVTVLTSPAVVPIQVSISPVSSNLIAYYRYEADEQTKEGLLKKPVNFAADKAATLYLSNAAAMNVTINGVALPIQKDNLPTVFRIAWRRTDDTNTLVSVPLP